LAKENIREFRRAVSVLKQQGLLPSGKKIDARSALPNWKIKGKKLSTLVRKYDDVVTGKATAIIVPPAQLKRFRKTGFETANKRVLIPHSKSEIAKLKHGQVTIKNKSGVERVQLPIEYHNLRQYLSDIHKNSEVINRMKRKSEYFGIRFFGGQRAMFYSNIEQLMDDLERYEDILKLTSSKPKQQEIYHNLEILRMTKPGASAVAKRLRTRKRVMSKEYNRRHAKRQRKLMLNRPRSLALYKASNAQRQADFRKRLKGPQKAHYLKQARLRAKRNKKKRSTKKKKRK
jgi:hypothetical protein